jgi:hypothetical protein
MQRKSEERKSGGRLTDAIVKRLPPPATGNRITYDGKNVRVVDSLGHARRSAAEAKLTRMSAPPPVASRARASDSQLGR